MEKTVTFEAEVQISVVLFFTPKGAVLDVTLGPGDPVISLPLHDLEVFVCGDKNGCMMASKAAGTNALMSVRQRMEDFV